MGAFLDKLENPRANAVEALQASVPADDFDRNMSFIAHLKADIRAHPVAANRAIHQLNHGALTLPQLQTVHLEYRHAIVQIFTDALLMAQFQTRQLEPRLAPGAKMPARFLLTLNTLDEFGFRPGAGDDGYYRGNPRYAHYPLYEAVLDDLGISETERTSYLPSSISQRVRAFLEQSFACLPEVVALLAVAEEEVILYSPPLRRATGALGLDVQTGYYQVHGTSDDESAEAFDDDHEDDLWLVLAQAMTEDQHARIRTLCLTYCDLWDEFWTHQMAPANAEQALLAG